MRGRTKTISLPKRRRRRNSGRCVKRRRNGRRCARRRRRNNRKCVRKSTRWRRNNRECIRRRRSLLGREEGGMGRVLRGGGIVGSLLGRRVGEMIVIL